MKCIITLFIILLPTLTWGQNVMSVLNRIHQVQKGETLSEIAIRYGISEEELLAANPEIKKKKLKKDTFLCIPTRQEVKEETPVPEPAEETTVAEIRDLKVGVVLPLEEKTEKGAKMIEFYQGFLMAADSVKKEGKNLDIYAWNSGNRKADIEELINKQEQSLAQMNIIFGPADVLQIPAMADFCTRNGIKLVLPFANSQNEEGHPLLYKATPSSVTTAKIAARFVATNMPNRNYIIVKTNQEDEKGKAFTATLTEELAKWGQTPRVLNVEGDEFAYEMSLNQFKENCLVPDNVGVKALNILISNMNSILEKHSDYKVSMLGYPEWQTYTGTLLKDFFRYDTSIYSTYFFNPLSEQTDQFQKAYAKNFGKPMQINYPVFSMMGFDLGYYFMHGEKSVEPYQHNFRFTSEKEGSGCTNNFIQLIHYTPEEKIELIK